MDLSYLQAIQRFYRGRISPKTVINVGLITVVLTAEGSGQGSVFKKNDTTKTGFEEELGTVRTRSL